MNLGVGAYRDENGKPWVLPCVQKAERQILDDPAANHEYLSMEGLPEFRDLSAKLLFGENSDAVKEKRVSTTQSISGTGANHLGAKFLQHHYTFPNGQKVIYLSDPTWPNHLSIFGETGINTEKYAYYDSKTRGFDFNGMKNSLGAGPEGTVILLHACAHNPSGVDPTQEQWKELAEVFKAKRHFAFFDCAYQGFASGNPDQDAFAVRYFVEQRTIPVIVCQSFAKNAGLYGERIGALHIVCSSAQEAQTVQSRVNAIQRSEISTPPAYGARIVARILSNPELRAEWDRDIKTMANRIIEMRKQLYDLLVNKYKTPGTWEHIINQTGMFSFLGLSAQACEELTKNGHIYLVKSSRISMAGLNPSNLDHVASWIDKVVRAGK